MENPELASPEHWDSRVGVVRARLPSRLNVGVRDTTDLLGRHIKPGDRVLEIGCAPGKYLLWCALAAQAKVTGVEYAPKSFRETVELFRAVGVEATLLQEDIFATSLPDGSFELVNSLGLIEHFEGDRLREIVRRHVDLLKPGGKVIIVVPDFSGWYGKVLRHNNPKAYATHNLGMMNIETLRAIAPAGHAVSIYRYGKLTPWISIWGAPRGIVQKALAYSANMIGLLQPFTIESLCPWLVLEITR